MTLIPQERVQSCIVEQVFDVGARNHGGHRRRRRSDLPWTCFWEDGEQVNTPTPEVREQIVAVSSSGFG